MKKLIFGLIATVLFVFVGNARIKESNSLHNSIISEQPTPIKFTFTVTIGFPPISVSVEVTCYRWSAHSPTYHCDYGRSANNSDVPENSGYIDIEQLDENLINLINEKNLTELEIQKSGSVNADDGNKLSIATGKYEILKDDKGRYLKIKVLVTK